MSFRTLPSVNELAAELQTTLPQGIRVTIARAAIDEARAVIREAGVADPSVIAADMVRTMERSRHTRVINATGVLLHTNLGRTPLHPEAAKAAQEVGTSFTNVEMDLTGGQRGGRGAYLNQLLTQLTGAEDSMVLNNCAATLLATLAALAHGAEVPVSRGELIEIGGSYRLPELMAASGSRLVEVGTTNRTRAGDYANAVSSKTALLLKVHPSNYQVTGFSEDASLEELGRIATGADIPLVYDLGSGLLHTNPSWLESPPPAWVANEPSVTDSLQHADLVMFSGDKLLGGPQAGIIVGSSELIAKIKTHPMSRALRIDGSTMAALTKTLEFYLDGRAAELPFWEMAARSYADLEQRLQALGTGEIREGNSTVGGGSAPGSTIASPLLYLSNGDALWTKLLEAKRPVLARRERGQLVIDLRTVDPDDDVYLAALLAR